MSAATTSQDVGIIKKLRRDHELLAGTGAYLVLGTLAYFWFQGQFGRWYNIEPIVVIVCLSSAALLFIPLLTSFISQSKYEVDATEAAAASGPAE